MERADRGVGSTRGPGADRMLNFMMLASILAGIIGFASFVWSTADVGSIHPGLQACFISCSIFGGLYALRWHKDKYGW